MSCPNFPPTGKPPRALPAEHPQITQMQCMGVGALLYMYSQLSLALRNLCNLRMTP